MYLTELKRVNKYLKNTSNYFNSLISYNNNFLFLYYSNFFFIFLMCIICIQLIILKFFYNLNSVFKKNIYIY